MIAPPENNRPGCAVLGADPGTILSAVTPVPWHGSGDVPALTRANVFLVALPDRAEWLKGDLIQVLFK